VLLDGLAVVVDVETTGIVKATDRVYEIGIVTFDSAGSVVDRFETLVRPDCALSARLEGPLSAAPSFPEIAGEVVERLRAGVVVGHAAYFDLSMINNELVRVGAGLPEVAYLCTNDLALALHVDTPSRSLGMLCHVLGVGMGSWHTAVGDAEVTGRLLAALLTIADARQLGARLRTPSKFPGTAQAWLALPRGGRLLLRDPTVFPPIGEQPDKVDPLGGRHTYSVSISLESLLTPELRGKLAEATARLEELNGGPIDTTEWDRACEEWEAGQFRGEAGLGRLLHILEVFLAEDDDQAPEVALKVAQFLRYDPHHSHDETVDAYVYALAVARAPNADDEEQRRWAVRDTVGDWAGYLAGRQDIDGLAELIGIVGAAPDLIGYLGVRPLVHQMRTAGQVDAVIAAAERLSQLLAAASAMGDAADVCAEWAQALAESSRSEEALAVCEQARQSGWTSRDLANRHSLLLERAKDWAGAVVACDHGLGLAPGDEQLTKRQERCRQHLDR